MDKSIITLIIVFIIVLYINKYIIEKFTPDENNKKIGIVTTVKKPHFINDFIKYHIKIGFAKIYIVLDDPNEILLIEEFKDKDEKIKIFKNDDDWKLSLEQFDYYKTHLNNYDNEVMSRQILNFVNVREYAKSDNIDWLLHIDCDELFYPQNYTLIELFNNNYDIISFRNYEMLPENDSYSNCFREGKLFKTNTKKFIAYVNGKSALKVNSLANITGVHGFTGGVEYNSPNGKILHYPSCNFDEYLTKYKILGNFNDKWWGKVAIPIKFHTESRDLINSCEETEEECINKIRKYYNDKHILNNKFNESDYTLIEYVENVLNN